MGDWSWTCSADQRSVFLSDLRKSAVCQVGSLGGRSLPSSGDCRASSAGTSAENAGFAPE